VTTGADRLICIDVPGHLEGIVTLNHIFGHFIHLDKNANMDEEPQEPADTTAVDDDDSEVFGRFCVTDLED